MPEHDQKPGEDGLGKAPKTVSATAPTPEAISRAKKSADLDGPLGQLRNTMEVTLSSVRGAKLPDGGELVLEDANAILAIEPKDFTWAHAYRLEKLVARIRPADGLEFEVDRQIEILKPLDPDVQTHYRTRFDTLKQGFATESGGKSGNDLKAIETRYALDLRSLLVRVLNDVHWKSAQRYQNRITLEKYTLRVCGASGLLAALFFAALFLIGVWGWAFSPYSGIILALGAGLVGAGFSLLTSEPIPLAGTSLEEMRRRTGFSFMVLRIGVGAIGAVILYFFFEAGLLDGVLFPELTAIGFAPVSLGKIDVETLAAALDVSKAAAGLNAITKEVADGLANEGVREAVAQAVRDNVEAQSESKVTLFSKPLGAFVPNADLSKLLVWSFVAGFSEKLVTSFLARVEESQSTQTQNQNQ